MFSVVIPLYNKENSITDTLHSVFNQDYNEFEVIVVDDGSIDASLRKVQEFTDARIRVIQQENQGVSAARNSGIKAANYSWIAFLDGDDLWKPNHLSLMKQLIDTYPSEKVFASSFEETNGRQMNGGMEPSTVFTLGVNEYFKRYLTFPNLLCTITIVADKDLLLQIGGFNPKIAIGEDLDLWARITQKTSIVKSCAITATYRLNAENRSDIGTYNMEKSFLKFIQFRQMKTIEEKKFYRYWIWHQLKFFLVRKELKNSMYLISKFGFYLLRY
ncbi:MAG: glycosyltransferase family 2 protein [Brumimicrobium sp.]|nr:glycosyltransferase family 2 protein [Brumimicrobium sp.]MCO5269267.1 glycosyltransferase family 2 protein [Brumimicrobium sp.]